jgi:protoheme ferro-lyase
MKPPIGVLLMAYGSPDSLDELAYLLDIRGGRLVRRPPGRDQGRYALIGGRSLCST